MCETSVDIKMIMYSCLVKGWEISGKIPVPDPAMKGGTVMKIRFGKGIFRMLLVLALVLVVPVNALADVLANVNEGTVYITGTTDTEGNATITVSQQDKTTSFDAGAGIDVGICSDYTWDYGYLGSPYFANSQSSDPWESPVYVDTDTDMTLHVSSGSYVPYLGSGVIENGGAAYVPLSVNTQKGATVTLLVYGETFISGGVNSEGAIVATGDGKLIIKKSIPAPARS